MAKRREVDGRRVATILMLTFAACLFVFSSWLWWQKIYNDPERVFWGAVGNNLEVFGVEKHVSQNQGPSKLEQNVILQTGGEYSVQTTTTITQGEEKGISRVVTEGIGVPGADFVRYTSVKTPQKTKDGKDIDFSKLLNTWGKAVPGQDESANDLLAEGMYGPIPFAHLSSEKKSEIMKFMRDNKVFDVAFSSAKRQNQNHRPVIVYKVDVGPVAYLGMLKKLDAIVGMNRLQGIDPNMYEGGQPIQMEVTIDVLSRQLKKINYVDTQREESYSGYGIIHHIAPPKDAIHKSELEQKLSNTLSGV